MTRSKGFLTNHPDEFALWLFRAHFCLRDDKQTEGMEAAQNLKRLGGIENTNPTVHQEMIDLNLRNWLQPAAESQKLIPIPTPASATFDFYGRGDVESVFGQFDKAISDYSEAIRLKPDFAHAFNGRALIYFKLKRYDKAIADYSEAIRLKPDFTLAYRNRAVCYDALGKTVEAERDRAKADKLETAGQ
jgi:tetratricopeptide (TPR) repeat protein